MILESQVVDVMTEKVESQCGNKSQKVATVISILVTMYYLK